MKIPKIEKTPNGQYYCRLRIGGQSVSVYGATEKECREQATLIKAKHKAGELEEKHGGLTLSKAIDQYIADRENVLSPSTIRGYRGIQRNRFKSAMGRGLDAVNWQQVINNEAAICSAKTLHNAWGLIASVLKDNGLPVPGVRLPQVVQHEMPWLDPEQIPVFMEAVKGEPIELAALLGLHGLRASEIYGLTWDNIDLRHGTFRVSGAVVQDVENKFVSKETNKNSASRRTVPIMIPRLAELLKQRQGSELFTDYPGTFSRKVKRVCERSGLPPVSAHGLRHSFASLAYHLGMSERECMRLGGWADNQTMKKIYTHLYEKDAAKAANKMADFYKNAK